MRLGNGVLLAGVVVLAGCQSYPDEGRLVPADLLISGGTVYDGSGSPATSDDLVIADGRIAYVGANARLRYIPAREIDATGLVVAPGFIDPHTHAGGDLASGDAERRANLPFVFQGVTTVVVGNDGGGSPDIADEASAASAQGIGTNVAYLAGFGPIREEVLGKEDRAPDEAELAAMKARLRGAMCEGAWGFSTGLYYVPQAYSDTAEVAALASVASAHGGYYDTHMRDESTYNVSVTGALEETLSIANVADIPVHIAHIKALGPAVWGHSAKMIEAIEEAQANGLKVTADQYPWEASGTRISAALVPRTALEGGLDALRQRLADPATRAAIRDAMVEAIARRGGAEKLLITGRLGEASVEPGRTLADHANAIGIDPVDAAIAILLEGDARLASFNMSKADIAAFSVRDWVVTGSDGSSGHPRKYGSFPKAYRDLVLDEPKMDLARFIERSSGQTARLIGLEDRGFIALGMAADIVIFDPAQFAPRATYQAPRELSVGVRHLLVNGEPVIADGNYTGSLPGKPLLKRADCD
ncbi:N-acyl-D-amino-acid deacylase family protein [Qipengyuania seohaensis]|uniref:N-acyl-D-amino-acid deacylase family protein n=1 Tax=Qipengyuania seohaensis TaxID=266951 RepID=UPI000C21D822|nr:amidohydrolase family protein [Qipengyuania seohaensis]